MANLTVGSLFDGIYGAGLAAERNGMKVLWTSEISRFACRVRAARRPELPDYGDIRAIDPLALPGVDVLTAGWPCQGNSQAGNRKGHGDARSGLFSEILRLVDGMAVRPSFLCLENVPGLVSVREGRDLAAAVQALQGRGYVGCVRRLDAQFDGLAQRRQRLWFVAGLGELGVRAVHALCEGGGRYPRPRREAGETVAASLTSGAASEGLNPPCRRREDDTNLVAFRQTGNGFWNGDGLAVPRAHPGGIGENLIAIQDGSRQKRQNGAGISDEGVMYSLDCRMEHAVAHTLRGEEFDASEDRTGRGTPIVAFDPTQTTSRQNGSNPQPGDPAPTLNVKSGAPTVAFTERTRPDGRSFEAQEDLAYALTNPGSGGRTHSRQIFDGLILRRLTPTECERLQGFSWLEDGGWQDGWTCLCGRNRGRSVAADGEPCTCPDGPRYRALGNAWPVPSAAWVLSCIRQAAEGHYA